jgi:hypothetical protein
VKVCSKATPKITAATISMLCCELESMVVVAWRGGPTFA